MTNTPLIDALEKLEDDQTYGFLPYSDTLRAMERFLRYLRANANGYVPKTKLEEIDEFLNQKP